MPNKSLEDSIENERNKIENRKWTILQVWTKICTPSISVFSVFAVTLSIFPSLTVHQRSVSPCSSNLLYSNEAFVPLLFLCFNLFDFVGRSLAGMFQIIKINHLLIHSFIRVIYFPLFLFCALTCGFKFPTWSSFESSNVWPILIMCIFALTNGYVSTICMMTGPKLMTDGNGAEIAGVLMIFSLTFGLTVGSGLSFAVTAIAKNGL